MLTLDVLLQGLYKSCQVHDRKKCQLLGHRENTPLFITAFQPPFEPVSKTERREVLFSNRWRKIDCNPIWVEGVVSPIPISKLLLFVFWFLINWLTFFKTPNPRVPVSSVYCGNSRGWYFVIGHTPRHQVYLWRETVTSFLLLVWNVESILHMFSWKIRSKYFFYAGRYQNMLVLLQDEDSRPFSCLSISYGNADMFS